MYIRPIENNTRQIYLSPQNIEKYHLKTKTITLHFGNHKATTSLNADNSLDQDVLGISKQLYDNITIPAELDYELRVEENNIYLGPVLAFIAFENKENLTPKKLNSYKVYFGNYQHIKGLIFICANDGFDTSKEIIEGYYYTADEENPWKPGTFPYPDAAYIRSVISKDIYENLYTTIGNRIFNTYSYSSFCKWTLWQMLSPISRLQKHLPHTVKLCSLETINTMLDLYGAVYLKPVVGTYSNGVIAVTKAKDVYNFIYPRKKKNVRATSTKALSETAALEDVAFLKDREYIVQQAVSMKRFDNRPIDFRMIMQKDGNNQWQFMGSFAKFGKPDSIITNFTQAGYLLSGFEALKQAFNFTEGEAIDKLREFKNIAMDICDTFDKHGNFGDIGIDLMIDENEKIWVIEVNTVDPLHKFPLYTNDRKLYERIVTNPFKYAKYLSGF